MAELIGSRWKPTGVTLGGGGQAQVFVVTDTFSQISGQSAAKVLLNNQRGSRIDREIAVAKTLHAAGAPILQILDDYLANGVLASRPWFVTPIASDGSLGKHLQAGAPYGGSLPAALDLFRKIANAVHQLHERNVAHRDLKPDNILLDGGKLLLCDLGLCLPLDELNGERLTGVLERIGSLNYLPKEAFGRRPLDQDQFAFDAYALGKMFYQLVSGRQLPGFVAPTDPDYDLTKIENSPVTRAINRTLRGLLHDTPAVRLATLGQLEEQVSDLLENIKTPQQTAPVIQTILMRAADAIADRAEARPQNVMDITLKQELESIRDEIFAAWTDSECLVQFEKFLIQPHSGLIELHRDSSTTKLRSILVGPITRTRRALEPIEDLGYPVFPGQEAGCALGIQSKADSTLLPSIWLGSLIAAKETNVWVAVAVATRAAGPNADCDIILGSQKVLLIGLHDVSLVAKVRAMAEQAVNKFTEVVADAFNSPK